MGAFRWPRDHYDVVRIVSGAFLVAVGLLLFFDRWWWLNVAFDRTFRFLGIGDWPRRPLQAFRPPQRSWSRGSMSFFGGKLDALLGRSHRLVATDSVDPFDSVIVDIARVDPDEVAEEYPDIPILGYTNHTDTAGLRMHTKPGSTGSSHGPLAERAPEIVEELVT